MNKSEELKSVIDSIAQKSIIDFMKENNNNEGIEFDSRVYIIAHEPSDDVYSEYWVDEIIVKEEGLFLRNIHDDPEDNDKYLMPIESVRASSIVCLIEEIEKSIN